LAGTRYSNFFWSDWISDDALAECSDAARGVWMGLLCMAARSPKIGFVMTPAGAKPSTAQIKRAIRSIDTEEAIEACIAELVKNKVCDTDRDGIIVSRRLVREEKIRSFAVKGGKARQRQRLENETQSGGGTSGVRQPPPVAGPGVQSPESRVQSPLPVTGNGENVGDSGGKVVSLKSSYTESEQLCRALGFSLTDDIRRQDWPSKLLRLKNEGIPFDALLAAARSRREAGLVPVDVYSPNFLKQDALAILRKWERDAASRPKPTDPKQFTRNEWIKILTMFLKLASWLPAYGPTPIQAGCLAPPDMIAITRKQWIVQGNHPLEVIVQVNNQNWNDTTQEDLDRYSHCPKPLAIEG